MQYIFNTGRLTFDVVSGNGYKLELENGENYFEVTNVNGETVGYFINGKFYSHVTGEVSLMIDNTTVIALDLIDPLFATINGVLTDITSTLFNGGDFKFYAVAGTKYTATISGGIYSETPSSKFNLEVNSFDGGRVGEFAMNAVGLISTGEFIAPTTGDFLIQMGRSKLVALDFVAPVESIDALINSALDSIKTYVDSKDATVKAYANALIDQLMQTTDLAAKIALLNQVNEILDGDSATAGFQLWESSVAKLNQVVADLVAESTARTSAISVTSNSLQTLINTTASEINARITTLDSSATANFVAMKAKAALIFAV